jgi:hypothetical protein
MCLDVNLSFGKAIDEIETVQTQAAGDLVAEGLSPNDIYSKTIPLTPDISRPGNIVKLVGLDFILDNRANALFPETLDLYIFSEEPLASSAALVPGALMSTIDRASYASLAAFVHLSAMPVSVDTTGIIIATFTESDMSVYIETGITTTLYAVLVTRSAVPSTIIASAELITRFKFEGVKS